MKIVKILSALILFSFIFLKSDCQTTSDSSQSKIDWNAKQFFLFSYFTGQASGAQLALSTDGLHWQQLNEGKPVIVPQVGSQKLMRDPASIMVRMVFIAWCGLLVGKGKTSVMQSRWIFFIGAHKRQLQLVNTLIAQTIVGRRKFFMMT